MNFKYKVGMPIFDISFPYLKGVVIRIDEDLVWFRWNTDTPDKEHCDCDYDIRPDTPEAQAKWDKLTKKVQAKVDKAGSHLEKAFRAWQEAADLQSGKDGAQSYALSSNPDLDLSKFENALTSYGWSTSSLYC